MGAPKLPDPITQEDFSGWYGEVLKDLEYLKNRTPRQMKQIAGRMKQVFHFIYGILRIDQLFEPDGRPMSIQPHLSIGPAHVVLAVRFVDGEPQVALNKRWREAAAEPALYMPAWERGKTVDPEMVFEYLGKEFLEIPRGGLDPDPNGGGLMSAREAAEELGMVVNTVIDLGFMNQDAAWVMTGPKVLLAVMGLEDASLLDEHESGSFTKGKAWVPAADLGDPRWSTDDAITNSVLWRAQKLLPNLTKENFVNPEDWENEKLRKDLDSLSEALRN